MIFERIHNFQRNWVNGNGCYILCVRSAFLCAHLLANRRYCYQKIGNRCCSLSQEEVRALHLVLIDLCSPLVRCWSQVQEKPCPLCGSHGKRGKWHHSYRFTNHHSKPIVSPSRGSLKATKAKKKARTPEHLLTPNQGAALPKPPLI